MNERSIGKGDTPYFARPFWTSFFYVAVVVGWICAVVFEPEFRPGVIEFIIGAALGVAAARVYRPAGIVTLAELSAFSQRHPWMKWFAFTWRATLTFRQTGLRVAAGLAVAYIGVFGGFALLYMTWYLAPWLSMPWARFALHKADATSTPVFGSWPAMIGVYAAVFLLLVTRDTRRWYQGLPSGDSSTGN